MKLGRRPRRAQANIEWSPEMIVPVTIRLAAELVRAVYIPMLRLRRSFDRAGTALSIRRELNELPDVLLKDLGMARSDIGYVARTLATRRATQIRLLIAAALVAAGSIAISDAAVAQDAQVRRGKYLVTIAGCNDCHTPGYFFGKPDMARFLGGSEVGFEIPGLGVFHGPNLTPDPETGLGNWTKEEIAHAVTRGIRPDGRILAPIMPWHAFASLDPQDVRAIAAYLKSLPPVKNKVPGPFGPRDAPTSFVMKIVPPHAPATDGSGAN